MLTRRIVIVALKQCKDTFFFWHKKVFLELCYVEVAVNK